MSALNYIVYGAMGDAAANGFFFEGQTSEQIAADMIQYNPALEDKTLAELMPHIAEWQAATTTILAHYPEKDIEWASRYLIKGIDNAVMGTTLQDILLGEFDIKPN